MEKYEACLGRVTGKIKTEENCTQDLLDFIGCRDRCVSTISIFYFLLRFAMHIDPENLHTPLWKRLEVPVLEGIL